MLRMTVQLTMDTNLLQELWRERAKRAVVQKLLTSPNADLAVTATIHEDIPRSPLADRLRELPKLRIKQTPKLARLGTWTLGRDALGSHDFIDFQHEIEASWAPGNRRLPDGRDFDHLHAHFAHGRDVFLTWDGDILSLAPALKSRLGITVQRPEDYLDGVESQAASFGEWP